MGRRTIKLRRVAIVFFSTLFLFSYSVYAKNTLEHTSSKQDVLLNALKEEGLPSVGVTYIEGGYIRYRQAIINTDIDTEYHLKPFKVGSLFPSSIFQDLLLATAVLRLVEQGKLSLDHRISDYLTSFFFDTESGFHRITLRHLLTHTSGVTSNEVLVRQWLAESANIDELCGLLQTKLGELERNKKSLIYEGSIPGQAYSRSVLGALLAQCIVSISSDEPLLDVIHREIVKSKPARAIKQISSNQLTYIQGRELEQCVLFYWGCWLAQVNESIWLTWLPQGFSHYNVMPHSSLLTVNKAWYKSHTSVNDMTRMLLSLLQNDNTSYRGNVLTQESIDELFMVQFPLSDDYMHRIFGRYLGEDKFKAESDEQGIYTFVFLNRKDENGLVVMIPTQNNYRVQRFIAKLMPLFGL